MNVRWYSALDTVFVRWDTWSTAWVLLGGFVCHLMGPPTSTATRRRSAKRKRRNLFYDQFFSDLVYLSDVEREGRIPAVFCVEIASFS